MEGETLQLLIFLGGKIHVPTPSYNLVTAFACLKTCITYIYDVYYL